MQENRLSDLDERIIHALQINPRARWSDLQPVLGADAVTLSRRWDSLVEQGIAWTTGFFVDGAAALIDITCVPQMLGEVTRALAQMPELVTLDHTSGERDILATATAPTPEHIWDLVTNQIGALPGVKQSKTHLVTEPFREASTWRLSALKPLEVAAIPRPTPPRARAPRSIHPDVEYALRQSLREDVRRPARQIARDYGLSEQRVSDGIARMIERRELRMRTDVARSVTGWPIYAWYFMQVPAKLMSKSGDVMDRIPQIRTALAVASQFNLVVAVWLRELNQVPQFESIVEETLLGSRIVDRSVVFRMSKHQGHLIDPQGRATLGFVHPERPMQAPRT